MSRLLFFFFFFTFVSPTPYNSLADRHPNEGTVNFHKGKRFFSSKSLSSSSLQQSNKELLDAKIDKSEAHQVCWAFAALSLCRASSSILELRRSSKRRWSRLARQSCSINAVSSYIWLLVLWARALRNNSSTWAARLAKATVRSARNRRASSSSLSTVSRRLLLL